MNQQELTHQVIAAAIEVHKELGPGLLESVYAKCLQIELDKRQINYDVELVLPIVYKGVELKYPFKADLIVEQQLLVELKSVEAINPVFYKQIRSYLKLANCKLGLIINFNESRLTNGIRRILLDSRS